MKFIGRRISCALALFLCTHWVQAAPRLSMFVGMDISGSFLRGKYFDDSLDFLAHYLYAHMSGSDGLEVPNALFVGSIGGVKADEPKTLFPIQAFQDKNIKEIHAQLKEIFSGKKENPFTDYNAFFEQVASTVKDKKLILRPISIVLISDGKPDVPGASGKRDYSKISLKPLENLSRNVTIRLLYTDAVVGGEWKKEIKRQRVKIWTADALVMDLWKDPKILVPNSPFEKQLKFFSWIKDNVDFGVPAKRVD